MPILKRDDGIQFAIHAYRELLQPAKASLLRDEIKMLAQNHGEYVRLFKLPSGQTEAVFSRDPGFLLGEAVWQYFGQPSDLVYCEALPEGHFAIIIVVRGGSVYLDTKIPCANIQDELAALVTGTNQYDIYTYGDVPISQTKTRGKFTFDKSQIKSFTQLPEPLFKNLPVDESLQLQPLDFAIRSQRIGKKSPLIISLVIAGIILLTWWFWHHRTKAPVVTTPQLQQQQLSIDPYAAYRTELNAPAPEKQIAEIANVITIAYGAPGWQATGVTFAGSSYTIQLNPTGGTVEFLNQWAESNNMQMLLNPQGVSLVLRSTLHPRPRVDVIYPVQQVIYLIIDRINQISPHRSVVLGSTISLPNYKTATLSIQVNAISPAVLTLIGRQLTKLPVKITAAQFAINNGLLTGSISLTVSGN